MQRDQGSFCLFEHSYVTTSIIKGKAKLNSFREFWKHKKVLQFSCVLGSSLGFSHWKGKAPAGLFGLRQAPAALRRKQSWNHLLLDSFIFPQSKQSAMIVSWDPMSRRLLTVPCFLPTQKNLRKNDNNPNWLFGAAIRCYKYMREIWLKI